MLNPNEYLGIAATSFAMMNSLISIAKASQTMFPASNMRPPQKDVLVKMGLSFTLGLLLGTLMLN